MDSRSANVSSGYVPGDGAPSPEKDSSGGVSRAPSSEKDSCSNSLGDGGTGQGRIYLQGMPRKRPSHQVLGLLMGAPVSHEDEWPGAPERTG